MRFAVKPLLGWFTVYLLATGTWQQLAPRSFYDHFPGFGLHWVDIDGPYNEHLLRDVGQGNIGLGALALTALLIGGVWLARATGLSLVVANVPHQVYHQAHLATLPSVSEQILQTCTLSFVSVTAIALAVIAFRQPVSESADSGTLDYAVRA